MSKDTCRSMGAIIGLVSSLLLMMVLGYSGVLPGAVFGAGGAVVGGMLGETLFAMLRGRQDDG